MLRYYEYMETKECAQCHRDLPIENFTTRGSRKDGKDQKCKLCKAYYKKLWWIRHGKLRDRDKELRELKVLENKLDQRRGNSNAKPMGHLLPRR